MPTIKPRCTVTFEDEKLKERIDEFRFTNRYRSQNDAIMALLGKGIEVLTGTPVNKPRKELSAEDCRLLTAYHRASPLIQEAVMMILEQYNREQEEQNFIPI